MRLKDRSAEDCVAALERLAPLQTRAVGGMRLCSLGRLLRIRREYLARLADCAGRGDGTLPARLGVIHASEEKDILAAKARLKEICGTLNTLQNRTRLSKSYLG